MSKPAIIPGDVYQFIAGERIIWHGKPERSPFILKSFLALAIALPFLILPSLVFFFGVEVPTAFLIFLVFWYGITGIIALAPLLAALSWRNYYYVLTENKLVVRMGAVGVDFQVVRLEDVQQVSVDVGPLDKIYGTGTIKVSVKGGDPVLLYAVRQPYRVQALILEAIDRARAT